MDVTDILRDRMHEPAGLQRMTAVSVLLHGLLAVVVILAPGSWFSKRVELPRSVMTITLGGGTPGPESGGMTSIGGRPIQVEPAPDAPKQPEPIRPPAAKTPEMTLPRPGPPARSTPAPVKQAPDKARGRALMRGSETTPGSTLAETGVRGQGFGLSTGGGAGSGSRLDVADFCCPEYVTFMLGKIRSNWNARAETAGETVIRFTIQRDGRIAEPEIETTSGFTALDLNALRATVSTRQLLPLPSAFPNPTLTVHLNFQYVR